MNYFLKQVQDSTPTLSFCPFKGGDHTQSPKAFAPGFNCQSTVLGLGLQLGSPKRKSTDIKLVSIQEKIWEKQKGERLSNIQLKIGKSWSQLKLSLAQRLELHNDHGKIATKEWVLNLSSKLRCLPALQSDLITHCLTNGLSSLRCNPLRHR